jgi:hypothetical protein
MLFCNFLLYSYVRNLCFQSISHLYQTYMCVGKNAYSWALPQICTVRISGGGARNLQFSISSQYVPSLDQCLRIIRIAKCSAMVWVWFDCVPQGFMCWKSGLQCRW